MDMSPIAEQCLGDQGVGHNPARNVAGGVGHLGCPLAGIVADDWKNHCWNAET